MSEPVFKALLIGNSKFENDPHELPELKGPANDIRGLEDALCHPQIGLHKPENINSMLNADHNEILEEMGRFFISASPSDQLLFYYSGHGRLEINNTLYLCARDTTIKGIVTSSVPDVMINSLIDLSKSKRIIVILDCCNSGRFKGEQDIPQNLLGEGRFIITSSRSKEPSVDAKDHDGYSAFTKYMIQALLSSEVDTNKDQFISLNELYSYILPKLQAETKQHPKRNFIGVVGELAIGKSNIIIPENINEIKKGSKQSRIPPVLAVSVDSIEIRDVSPDEKLPEEMIDVYNKGGGGLDWIVESQEDWINVKKFKTYFTVNFNPKPGNNRGRIYVRDKKNGGSKRIPVIIQMNQEAEKPKLKLSSKTVNFGSIIVNSSARKRTLRLINEGDGELKPSVSCTNDKLKVIVINDLIEITPDISQEGKIEGEILIKSLGGNGIVKVKAIVEKGPVLSVSPSKIDFGSVTAGDDASKTIKIKNSGSSDLEWSFEQQGDFFDTEKKGDQLSVTLDATSGSYHGSIIIKSNGGDKTIDIKGKVRSKQSSAPATQSSVDISGTWSVPGVGYLAFRKQGAQYVYQDLNIMGVVVAEGTATMTGNKVTISGVNLFAGAIYGEFTVSGNIMTGYMSSLGNRMNFTLTKQSSSSNTGFNWMSLFN